MLIINNKFLSLYDYNFLLVIERRKNKRFEGHKQKTEEDRNKIARERSGALGKKVK